MELINKILNFLYGSLIFLTPLIFAPNTSELFEFNKMLFIYLITTLIGLLWIIKMILAKKLIFKKTFLDIPILIFFLSQILSTVLSIDRNVSLFGYYGRFNGGLLSILSYVILFYGLISNRIGYEILLKSSLWSSVVVVLYGLPGKLGHDITCFLVTKTFDNSCWSTESNVFNPAVRSFSTLGQPNWLGAFLAVNFFIGLYFFVKNLKNVKFLMFNSLYLLANFSFILFSRSRSALAAVGVGLIIYTLYHFLFIKKDFNKIFITFLIITIFPVILFKTGIDKIDNIFIFSVKSNNQKIVKQTSPLVNPDITESLDIRKIVWQGAIDLGLKYPLFGTGVETFGYSYYLVRPVSHNLTSEWDFVYNKAHNEFLNYLATTGFIGLGSYLIMLGTVIFYLIKHLKNSKDNLKISLLIAYLTILITNFFGFSTTTLNLFLYLIPAFVILSDEKAPQFKFVIDKKVFYQYLSIAITSFIAIYLLFSIFSYWLADNYYSLGINYSKPQIADYQKAAMYFEKALKIRDESIYEDRFSSALSYLVAIAAYQKQNDLAKQLTTLSDYYNKKSLLSSQKNIFYWKTRAKNEFLYYQVSQDEENLNEGIKALLTGEKLAPTDPKIPYSLAVYYSLYYDQTKNNDIKEKTKQSSLLEIDRALNLKKDFQDAITLRKQLFEKYKTL